MWFSLFSLPIVQNQTAPALPIQAAGAVVFGPFPHQPMGTVTSKA
jgi:hypothetical protein